VSVVVPRAGGAQIVACALAHPRLRVILCGGLPRPALPSSSCVIARPAAATGASTWGTARLCPAPTLLPFAGLPAPGPGSHAP